MSTINETSNNGNSSSGSSSGSSGLQNISTNDQVDPSMGVSPISKRVATGDGSNDNHQKRTLKRTSEIFYFWVFFNNFLNLFGRSNSDTRIRSLFFKMYFCILFLSVNTQTLPPATKQV